MLHKPRGFITTLSDEMGRKCVAQLVEDVGTRVYPVGRLDRDSEGLLLLTDDGEFANDLTHPSRHVNKTYRVTVKGEVSDEALIGMREGVVLDGKKTLPCDVFAACACLLFAGQAPCYSYHFGRRNCALSPCKQCFYLLR